MANLSINVPDDLQRRFEQAFGGANPGAVLARLMEEAIVKEEQVRQSDAAVRRVLARRQAAPAVSLPEILAIRDALREESDAGNAPGR